MTFVFKNIEDMKKVFAFILMLLPLYYACSNDNETPMSSSDEMFSLKITWNNVEYDVPCTLDKNGKLVFCDGTFKAIYEKEIAQYDGQGLVTYLTGESSFTYYPSVDVMMKELGLHFLDQNAFIEGAANRTRIVASSAVAGTVNMWRDPYYSGEQLSHMTWYTSSYWCRKLSNLNYNDKAASIRVTSSIPLNDSVYVNYSDVEFIYNEGYYSPNPPTGSNLYMTNDLRVVFMGYKHTNYGGNVLIIIPNNSSYKQNYNLTYIGWSKEISSDVIRIAVSGLYSEHQ